MAVKKKTEETENKGPAIKRMDVRTVEFVLKGLESVLVTHKWSEKAKKEMRDKQQKKARGPREPKNPQAEYEAARYLDTEGRDCIPAIAFKKAIVDAASFSDDATKVILRGSVFVIGDLLPIEYEQIRMREDVVRVQMSTDLRYRPEYANWRIRVSIQYDASQISLEQLLNFVGRAGFSIGIGEHRPQKNGQNGRFTIETYTEKREQVS